MWVGAALLICLYCATGQAAIEAQLLAPCLIGCLLEQSTVLATSVGYGYASSSAVWLDQSLLDVT